MEPGVLQRVERLLDERLQTLLLLLLLGKTTLPEQGCSGAGTRRGDGVPPLFSTGDASPTPPHFFGLKFVQKLVHCCNWLLTETQCKIISVQQRVNIDLLRTLKHE